MNIKATILTCKGRECSLAQTIRNFEQTDWPDSPVIFHDPFQLEDRQESQTRASLQLLTEAHEDPHWDFLLFLEDDLRFNLYLYHNLQTWLPMTEYPLATLYGHTSIIDPERKNYVLNDLLTTGGSQALLIRRDLLKILLHRWENYPGLMQDLRIRRIVSEDHRHLLAHVPDLIQHRLEPSTWGGPSHYSFTFDPIFRREE